MCYKYCGVLPCKKRLMITSMNYSVDPVFSSIRWKECRVGLAWVRWRTCQQCQVRLSPGTWLRVYETQIKQKNGLNGLAASPRLVRFKMGLQLEAGS